MDIELDKVLSRGDRPGYGIVWQFKDLPDLQLVQGLYGGSEWTITRAGDGFFFLHDEKETISRLAQAVLDKAGNQPYSRKTDAMRAYRRAMSITSG
jgi:hypothetical protein